MSSSSEDEQLDRDKFIEKYFSTSRAREQQGEGHAEIADDVNAPVLNNENDPADIEGKKMLFLQFSKM